MPHFLSLKWDLNYYLIPTGLLWRLSNLTHMKHLEEFSAHPNCLINVIQHYDYYFYHSSFLLGHSGFLGFNFIRGILPLRLVFSLLQWFSGSDHQDGGCGSGSGGYRTVSSGQSKGSGGLTVGEATSKLQLLCKYVKIQNGFRCHEFSTLNPATGGQRKLTIL